MLNEQREDLCVRLSRTIFRMAIGVVSTILGSILDDLVNGWKA